MPKGRVLICDEGIVEAYTSGMFIGEIRKKYKVGKNRIITVLDRAGVRKGHEAEAS